MESVEDRDAGNAAVDRALLNRRQHVAKRHRDRCRTETSESFGLEVGREDTDLLALEVREVTHRRPKYDAVRLRLEHPGAMQALIGSKAQHQLEHLWIAGETLAMLQRFDQSWRGHHLEALVNADEKLGRNDRRLDRAELYAFDLPRNRAELARRINLGLDASSRQPLDRGAEILGKLMRRIVKRWSCDFHHVGLVLRLRGRMR